jgi:dipeptidyl aminopeptidase/acylaminoacyl peptidase
MKRYFCAIFSFVVAVAWTAAIGAQRIERGSLLLDDVPPIAPATARRIEEYLSAREAAVVGWSPQGQLLVATRFGDTTQLHLVERAGGARRQLTFEREAIGDGAFCPDPARSSYFYLEDAAGDERFQLYYRRLGESASKMLTDGKSANSAALWSNSGRAIAFSSTARDGKSLDINIVEPESGALPRLVLAGDGAAWTALDWSPDDGKLLALKVVSSEESHLFLVDIERGEKRELDPAASNGRIMAAKFARDGQGAYVISDRDSEFAQLRYVNFFNAQRTLISGHIAADIEEVALSGDGRYLAYVSNEGGFDKLNLQDLVQHQDLTPPRLPSQGSLSSLHFDPQGKRLAFSFGSTAQPGDAYVLDLATNRLEAWTVSEAGALDLARFAFPRSAAFPSFDRDGSRPREIPAFIYEPATPGAHPALILLRGTEHAQFRPGFDPWIQYLVNELGFAVVAPNLRGASGYGKSYAALNEGRLRGDAVKDIGALLVYLRAQSAFDAEHIVIAGESYGGYLALDALVNFSERLRGAIDMAGIVDFVGMLGGAQNFRQDALRREFGDERDPDLREYLRHLSPLTNADRISRPVLVVHGANDPYVAASQAQDLVYRLRSHGMTAWYLLAGDAGREFRQLHDREAYLETAAEFLTAIR